MCKFPVKLKSFDTQKTKVPHKLDRGSTIKN